MRGERRDAEGEAGWLAGLPVAIKDLTEVAGVRTTFGSPIFADYVPAKSHPIVERIERMGGIATPCHPGRVNVGLCAHYETKPPLEGVVAVEALNGGSKAMENERVKDLMSQYGYHGFGGSDSHLVSFIGVCATEFDHDIEDEEGLVVALKAGSYRAVDFRQRAAAQPAQDQAG